MFILLNEIDIHKKKGKLHLGQRHVHICKHIRVRNIFLIHRCDIEKFLMTTTKKERPLDYGMRCELEFFEQLSF